MIPERQISTNGDRPLNYRFLTNGDRPLNSDFIMDRPLNSDFIMGRPLNYIFLTTGTDLRTTDSD
ncbi:MAG: hypothetical protein LBQ77_03590 [Treponema sp.]|nr:hypothetical protein [Treponema sp.]